MKKKILITAMMLLAGGGILHAQVRVQVNGDRSFVIDERNGLYFHNDTMTVAGEVFALDDITVITLQPELAINDIEASDLRLAPNPAQEYISLQGVGSEPQQAVLYSTAGVKLMEQTVADGSVLNISHLPEGVYILRTANRVAKIVKQL